MKRENLKKAITEDPYFGFFPVAIFGILFLISFFAITMIGLFLNVGWRLEIMLLISILVAFIGSLPAAIISLIYSK